MTTDVMRPVTFLPLARLARGLRAAADAVRRLRARRRTHESLSHLDERMLKDIGVEVICVPDGVNGRTVVRAYRIAPRHAA